MKFYQVTDKDLANEVKSQVEKMNSIQKQFVNVASDYGFSGAQIKGVGFWENLNDVVCRGFSATPQAEQGDKFKSTCGGAVRVPKKKYEQEVKEKLGGLEFNYEYSMVDTWNKIVTFQIYHDQSGFVRDGINSCFIDGNDVYVALNATHENANLNVNALKEIKESDYLAIQGK